MKKNKKDRDILDIQRERLQMVVDDVKLRDSVMRNYRFKEGSELAELSDSAIARLDVIDNAVFDMLQELVEDDKELE